MLVVNYMYIHFHTYGQVNKYINASRLKHFLIAHFCLERLSLPVNESDLSLLFSEDSSEELPSLPAKCQMLSLDCHSQIIIDAKLICSNCYGVKLGVFERKYPILNCNSLVIVVINL